MAEYKYNYLEVPDDPILNKKWREETLFIASQEGHPNVYKFRNQILQKCKKDFWYWAKGFAWVHESRILDDETDLEDLDTKVAFLPWPHQIPVVNHILKVLGKKDIRLVKSRAQGASWLMILIAIWLWIFKRGSITNFVSKDMDAADKPGDMNSLGAKADWLIEMLPEWMVGRKKIDWIRSKTDHAFKRMDGETVMVFFACTANVATGGRSLWFVVDEHGKHQRPQDADAMASMQPVTRCRMSLSTPFGMDGEFAKIIHDETIDEPVLRLAWWDNPTQNRGLYRIIKGKPVPEDEEKYGPLPEKYKKPEEWNRLKSRLEERGYDLTNNQLRSSWYDEECLRQGAGPLLIAQEYDMNFGMSMTRYFSDALINRLLNNISTRPIKGDFQIDSETLVGCWSENPDGRFKIWVDLDIRNQPPTGEYIIACDVSLGIGGSGGSNSCICVLNRRTGKKVLSFASPSIEPHTLAEIAVGLCKWFCNYRGDPGFLIWENQGPGMTFFRRIERSGFQNFYYRRQSQDSPYYKQNSGKPGYWMQKRDALLGPYKEALLEGYFDNQDREAIEELRQYQVGQDGQPYHVSSKDKTDPSGAGSAHGDRTVSEALAWHASQSFGDQHSGRMDRSKPNVMTATEENVPRDTFAWRRAQYLKMMRKEKNNKRNW